MTKNYYITHKTEITKHKKKYYENNKEKLLKKAIEYQNNHKEEHKIAVKKYYKTHKEKMRIQSKKYRKTHKKQISQYAKEYNKNYKEEKKIYDKEYRKIHKKEIKEYRKKYMKKYKSKLNDHQKEYNNNRRKININFKLSCYLRNRVYSALRGLDKSAKTMELLDCSIDFLKQYLELQFKPGMLWKNYGKWHIDHIKPCARFDLSNPKEQKKCFNYTNLQPLWAEENFIKKDRPNDTIYKKTLQE